MWPMWVEHFLAKMDHLQNFPAKIGRMIMSRTVINPPKCGVRTPVGHLQDIPQSHLWQESTLNWEVSAPASDNWSFTLWAIHWGGTGQCGWIRERKMWVINFPVLGQKASVHFSYSFRRWTTQRFWSSGKSRLHNNGLQTRLVVAWLQVYKSIQ